MCLSRFLKWCGFFPDKPKLPSFGDGIVELDHEFDVEMNALFQKIIFPETVRKYNPKPEIEKQVFIANPYSRGEMLQRNALLLSRLFIRNAKRSRLAEYFKNKTKIRILDLGCGNGSPSLMGILAYLGMERVEYVGVDLNKTRIIESQRAYKEFPNVTFINQDILEILRQDQHYKSYDLVLIQHPNIESPSARDAFAKCFVAAEKVLAEGGIIYSTFYYESEVEYFRNYILPKMGEMKGTITRNASYDKPFINRHSGEAYFPENYSFISAQKVSKENLASLHSSPAFLLR